MSKILIREESEELRFLNVDMVRIWFFRKRMTVCRLQRRFDLRELQFRWFSLKDSVSSYLDEQKPE